jgi:hypothetical protein
MDEAGDQAASITVPDLSHRKHKLHLLRQLWNTHDGFVVELQRLHNEGF